MRRMVEFPLADGGLVLAEVEVDQDEQDGIVPAARAGEIASRATQTFEDAIDKIRPAADVVVARLRALAARPDEMEVTFGLKLSAAAGAFVAAAGSEANFTVVLRWNG
jgi:hypothetical protein